MISAPDLLHLDKDRGTLAQTDQRKIDPAASVGELRDDLPGISRVPAERLK